MHPGVIISLDRLAALHFAQGMYEKAEALYLRAIEIGEMAGKPDSNHAVSMHGLAVLYQTRGALAKAEPLYTRALDLLEEMLGQMHPGIARILTDLASLYQAQGAYAKAEPLYIDALDIRESLLGPAHLDVAHSLTSLASLYRDQKAYEKAKPLLRRALDIYTKELGPGHPVIANSLSNLAMIYEAQGAHGRAEQLLSRAAEIREDPLRVRDPELSAIDRPTQVDARPGDAAQVDDDSPRAAKRARSSQDVALLELSAPLAAPRGSTQGETDRLVSLHVHAMPGSGHALEVALTAVLRRKGRVLDLDTDNTRASARLTPALRDQVGALTRARGELLTLLHRQLVTLAHGRAMVATVRARIGDLESELRATSAEFRLQSEPVTMAKIQSVLPRGVALVEFVRYCRFDARQVQPWQEGRYVAYVLMSHGPPQWVALGTAASIDAEVDAVLAAIHRNTPLEATKASLQRLDALVFAPIRTRLTGVQHVIFAPDGELNLLPFEALLDRHGRYLLESYLVSYVTTGRDLLRFATPQAPRSSAVIVAGPDYGPRPAPGQSGAVSFAPLAQALVEASALRMYFPAPPVTGRQATKSVLAALTGPAMLHVATHGFYARELPAFPASASTTPAGTASALPAPSAPGQSLLVSDGDSWLLPPPRFEDPVDGLDRAGLAMAGANQGASGILTAREIAGFDWRGTQLVMLTACEPPSNATRSAAGMYGLRRALVLAGTESQIISLWMVNDPSARRLMFEYYGELVRGGGRAEALRRAKLHLLREPGYAHPYYWAAFLPSGDWRPLDKNTLPRSATTR